MTGLPDTPFLAVDRPRLEANLAAGAAAAAATGAVLRPHAKTHKCAQIAARQMDSGAVGLTVATIGEAEAFAEVADETGCRDLFIAYPLWVTPAKGARLRALATRMSLRLAVDSPESARRLAAELGDHPVEVLVEVDSGQHRTGVAPESAGVIGLLAADAGLDVVGVFTFPGHGYGPGDTRAHAARDEAQALSRAADALAACGIEPRVRSGGSTPTVAFTEPGVLTEVRPGVYPFNDAQQVEMGTCAMDQVSLTAIATVVHRTGDRVVLDAGSKILGADRPAWASGHGRLRDHPAARITALSEHHAVVDLGADPGDRELLPGARVAAIPNHVCTAVNLVDELTVTTATGDDDRWAVLARGRNA